MTALPAQPGVKRPRPCKSDVTRHKILDASAKLFREQGFSATTLRQIANRSKMKAGSVYYYFDSKNQILDEVLRIGIKVVFEAVEKAVDALPENASGRARLEAAVAAHLHTLLRYSDYTSANIRIFGQVSRTSQNRNRAIRRTYAEYWNGLLQHAKDSGEISPDADLSLIRLFLLGSVNWSVEWYDPKKRSTEFLAEKFCKILFEGIGG